MSVKAAGLGVKIEIPPDSKARLNAFERISPKLLRRAYARAANTAKRALFATIKRHGNAKYGVAKLARRQPITRRLWGGKPSDIFGKFSSDPTYLVAYLRGETQVLGWPDRLHGFLGALQMAERREWTEGERRLMYARLAEKENKAVRLPASYNRPERPLIEPFAENLAKVYPQWIIGNFNKMYNAKVARR